MSPVEVAPGLRRWMAWHEEWKQEVGSLAVQTPDGLVLIDPIDPPPELRRPDHVLIREDTIAPPEHASRIFSPPIVCSHTPSPLSMHG